MKGFPVVRNVKKRNLTVAQVRFGRHALAAMLGADSMQNASERNLRSDEKWKP
jgi:hypothetical protein